MDETIGTIKQLSHLSRLNLDEDGETTSTFGYTNQLVKTRVNGFFSDFHGQTNAENTSPAGEVPGESLLGDPLTLCVGQPTGIAPWEITP